MAADPIGPEHTGRLDSKGAGHDRVVALADRRAPLTPARRAEGIGGGTSAVIHRFGLHFTAADRAALAAWASNTGHGYDRLRLERGPLDEDLVTYALVYVPGQAWSTWGVMRWDDRVEVWRCANGQTVGRHARMADALASLPHATDHRRTLPVDTGRVGMRIGSRRRQTR